MMMNPMVQSVKSKKITLNKSKLRNELLGGGNSHIFGIFTPKIEEDFSNGRFNHHLR